MSDEQIWQVRLPDGSVYIPVDARPDTPRRSWIYSRSIADIIARDEGGTVVEVSRHQQKKLLDQEIESALVESRKTRAVKTRPRSFLRAARKALATTILENVPLTYHTRAAVDTAREAVDEGEYNRAIGALKRGLPTTLWIGYDPRSARGFVQEGEPLWNTDSPQGEDPGKWRQADPRGNRGSSRGARTERQTLSRQHAPPRSLERSS